MCDHCVVLSCMRACAPPFEQEPSKRTGLRSDAILHHEENLCFDSGCSRREKCLLWTIEHGARMRSHMSVVAVFMCLLLSGVTITESFPNGAPIEACIYQTVPNHTGTKPGLPSTFQHEFVATRGSYVPGSTIHVHVSGPKIKGFFIQAIDDNYKPIGSFIKNDFSKLHDECSAITHTHPGPKKDLSFIWKAPHHGHGGNVYFRATILEEYDKYWSKVFAKVLRPPHF